LKKDEMLLLNNLKIGVIKKYTNLIIIISYVEMLL